MYCAVARALDVVGDRWSLLVVRELATGPKRHADLMRGLPGIATNVLSGRLKALQAADVVIRRTLPRPANVPVYELTERGHQLEPAMMALAAWGEPLLGRPAAAEQFRLAWVATSLRHRIDPSLARDPLSVRLEVEGEQVTITVGGGSVTVHDDVGARADIVLSSDRNTFLRWGTSELTDAQARARGLHATGGQRSLARLRRLFALPPARGAV